MITKFKDLTNQNKVIEFSNLDDTLLIFMSDFDPNLFASIGIEITLSKYDLFELIGQLLRIQSIIKK